MRRLLLPGMLALVLVAGVFEGLARYAEHRVLARVSAALGYATLVKAGISIHNELYGELPEHLDELDMSPPHAEHYLADVQWHRDALLGGGLSLYFAAVGGEAQPGDRLLYRARIDQYGRVRWQCDPRTGEGLLPPRYRTPQCLE